MITELISTLLNHKETDKVRANRNTDRLDGKSFSLDVECKTIQDYATKKVIR